MWSLSRNFIQRILVVTSGDRRQVNGGAALKASQEYPIPFGRAVERLFTRHRAELIAAITFVSDDPEITLDDLTQASGDPWTDANLGPVFDVLMAVVDQSLSTS